jgi:hypothetical protein
VERDDDEGEVDHLGEKRERKRIEEEEVGGGVSAELC